MFLRAVEAKLRAASPGALADARFGGVTFVQRFGSALVPPARGPSQAGADYDQRPAWEAEAVREINFDQRQSW